MSVLSEKKSANGENSSSGCAGMGAGVGGPGVQVTPLTRFLSLGLAAPPTVRIVHSGLACNIEEERYSERVYTIREGETLELTCLVTGHPRPQVSPRPRHPLPSEPSEPPRGGLTFC